MSPQPQKDWCRRETGRLAEAIHVERRYERGRVLTYVVAGDKEAFYGHFVEYGHKRRGGGWVPPHPFLIPAAEASRKVIENRGRNAVRDACE